MFNPELSNPIPSKKENKPLWGKNDRLTLRVSKDENQEPYVEAIKGQLELYVRNVGEFLNQVDVLKTFENQGLVNHESKALAEGNILNNFKTSLFVDYYQGESKTMIDSLVKVLDLPSDIASKLCDRVYKASENITPTLKSSTSLDAANEDYEVFNEREALGMISDARIKLLGINDQYTELIRTSKSDSAKKVYSDVLEGCHELQDRLVKYHGDAITQFRDIRLQHGRNGDSGENLYILKKNINSLIEDINLFASQKMEVETLRETEDKSEGESDGNQQPPVLGDWSDL